MHEIRQGVPIPPKSPKLGVTFTLRQMKPGDYVEVPTKTENVRSLITQLRARGELVGLSFTLRKRGERKAGVWCL